MSTELAIFKGLAFTNVQRLMRSNRLAQQFSKLA